MVEVETEFNDNIHNLIKETEQMDCSQTLRAYSLGVTRQTYRSWLNKYGGLV